MTPIIRLLSFILVFLLALILAATATRFSVGQTTTTARTESFEPGESSSARSNWGVFSLLDRSVLALSVSALIVAIVLVFLLGGRARRPSGTRAPFSSRERERRSLDLLATTSARAQ
ncbi:MAG: hypothetical protein QNK90_01620 [Opitutaceae bacterium]